MRYLNKIASAFCAAALGLLAMTSCEGGDLYNVNSPDWLSEKIDSINNAKGSGQEEVLEGMMEDVYTIGATDYSTGWWAAFSKYYQIADGETWNAQFNLSINPDATNTYKNFALIICNDEDRGAADYKEYGAIRFDHQPASNGGNSEWGDHINRDNVTSTLTFQSDTDKGVDKLGGKVTLTIDRSNPNDFIVKITNGTVTKTYNHKAALENLNADAANTTIRAFLVPEGSYINFLATNVEPIGGCTSALDKAPLSMELSNVPEVVKVGTTLEEAVENVSATVTFEEGVTKVIPAAELMFTAIPDMDQPGEKTLVVIYNKTFKGENANQPIVAYAKFRVVTEIESITVTKAPAQTTYCIYGSEAVTATGGYPFNATGLEVTATYSDGEVGVVNNASLTFSAVPTTAGTHKVTITTENGKSTTVDVTVKEAKVTTVHPTPTVLGAEDNTSGWWSAHTDNILVPAGETYQVNFTNYSSLGANWNNFVIVLRSADNATEYAVVRADNFGWGIGYDGNAALRNSGGQADWGAWLAAMNGAKCTAYITNCGDGTADIQAVMKGTDGVTYYQYYLGICNVNVSDCNFAFTVDSSHYVFE